MWRNNMRETLGTGLSRLGKQGKWHFRSPRNLGSYCVLVVCALFFSFPIVFMVISSFKSEKQIFLDLSTVVRAFLPTEVTLENYLYIFNRVPFWRFFANSLIVTVSTVSLGVFLNSMFAYALARLYWPGKQIILFFVIGLSIVPLETIAIPMLVLVNKLPWFDGSIGWLDSYRVQIFPFAAEAFSTFLFYQFFIGIPKELDESCYLDGAKPFRIYWQIIIPLSTSIFSTVIILQSLTIWNSYLWPLMVTRSEQFRPLPIGITSLYVLNMRWGHVLAFASLITVPILILFLIFQKWFVQSIATSGLKG